MMDISQFFYFFAALYVLSWMLLIWALHRTTRWLSQDNSLFRLSMFGRIFLLAFVLTSSHYFLLRIVVILAAKYGLVNAAIDISVRYDNAPLAILGLIGAIVSSVWFSLKRKGSPQGEGLPVPSEVLVPAPWKLRLAVALVSVLSAGTMLALHRVWPQDYQARLTATFGLILLVLGFSAGVALAAIAK